MTRRADFSKRKYGEEIHWLELRHNGLFWVKGKFLFPAENIDRACIAQITYGDGACIGMFAIVHWWHMIDDP